MKRLILLLITLATFTNVSYASFPVTETQQIEIVETCIVLIIFLVSAFITFVLLLFREDPTKLGD